MARIEWVMLRLENWALWYARMNSGGLGYASQAIFADGPSVRGQVEVVIPVDEIDASVTNDAVESLKLGHGHLYQTLHLYYIKGLGIIETAHRMRRAESTVKSNLGQADQLISIWFRARAEARTAKPADVGVRLLSREEIEQLQRQLAEERATLEARRRPTAREFVGPPRPPFRRNRPVLRLRRGGFTT
jgi:hypothetical protein